MSGSRPPTGPPRGPSEPAPSRSHPPRSWWIAGILLVAIFWTIAAFYIGSGLSRGRSSFDAVIYHEPAFRIMARELPTPELSNFFSATTPGYHYMMALFVRAGVTNTAALKGINTVITCALILVLARAVSRRASPAVGFVCTLPYLFSIYTMPPGVALLPDNLAWLFVLGAILVTLEHAPSWRATLFGGALAFGAVMVKQIHLWTAAIVWIGALAGARAALPTRAQRGVIAGLVTLPMFAVVYYFYSLWDGLVPPRFQTDMQGINLATPGFMLVQIGMISIFYATLLFPAWRDAARGRWPILIAVALVGAVLVILPETTYSPEVGRNSGWWRIGQVTPTLFGHTTSGFLILGPVGACALVLWGIGLPARSRVILGVTFLAFLCAHTAMAHAWQRYHEPMLLILSAIAAGETLRERRRVGTSPLSDPTREVPAAVRLSGPVALSVMLGAISAFNIATADLVRPGPLPTGQQSPGDPEYPYDLSLALPMKDDAGRERTRNNPSPYLSLPGSGVTPGQPTPNPQGTT